MLDHFERDTGPHALGVEVLKEARLVLELIGDPLDRRALADGEALERSR